MLKNYLLIHRQYILIVLTATIFLFNFISPSLSKTNIFYVKNIQVSKKIDTSDEWIKTRTGIHQRHIADEKQMNSDHNLVLINRLIFDLIMVAYK